MKLDDDTISQNGDGNLADLDELDDLPDGWFTPEREQIIFPSTMALGEIEHQSLTSIVTIEAKLCKRQITNALAGLHLSLGGKAICFQIEVRNANSQRTMH